MPHSTGSALGSTENILIREEYSMSRTRNFKTKPSKLSYLEERLITPLPYSFVVTSTTNSSLFFPRIHVDFFSNKRVKKVTRNW